MFFLINYAFQRAVNNVNAATSPANSEQSRNTVEQAIKSLHVRLLFLEWLNPANYCCEAWIYALRAIRVDKVALVAAVTTPLTYAIQFLPDPHLGPITMELLTDVLTSQQKLLSFTHFELILEFLISDQGEKYALTILEGVFETEQLRFLELLIRFVSAEEQIRILTEPPDEKHQRILFLLFKLFETPGYPAVEDMTTNPLIEFWTEAADNLSELIMEGAFDEPTPVIKGHFTRVVDDCFDKLRYPSATTLKGWDDDDIKLFNEFRRDFKDFLLASYPLLGVELIQRVQERAAAAIQIEDWQRFEVAMFCLAALAETVAENQHADNLLHALFQSALFNAICYGRTEIPQKARQTLSDVIARYTPYFERNHVLLPPVLNFLFVSLTIPSSEQAAAKSICSLCGTCRQHLTVFVQELIVKFAQLHASLATSNQTLERVAEAIASVIQAVNSEPEKANLLGKLLGPLYQEATQACQIARDGQQEMALTSALRTIGCTASIGKGMRAPDEAVVDLVSDDGVEADSGKDFWTNDPHGLELKTLIVRILECLVGNFATEGDILESACDVLRAGYTEKSPGPFVLPPQVTVNLVRSVDTTSARFPVVMATASAFLASRASKPWNPSDIHAEVVELILHVYSLLVKMAQDPAQYDPEAAHSCIEFLSRLLPKYATVLFSLIDPAVGHAAVVPTILQFTIATLKGPDPLPLRAACAFWTTLLGLPNLPPAFTPQERSRAQGENGTESPFEQYLAQLASVVIRQIAGRCARSDLEHFTEILKKFTFKHPSAARYHFSKAITELDTVSATQQPMNNADVQLVQNTASKVSAVEREKFLSSILAMRGSGPTLRIVTNFWIACRGRGFTYA